MASNETASSGAHGAGLSLAALVRYISDNPLMLAVNAQIYAMAAAVIYAAAHAALTRPPSAAPEEASPQDAEDGADGANTKKQSRPSTRAAQDLRLSDALALPIMGACALGSVYFLLKYLEDPSIISRIMRGNVVLISIVSGGAIFSAALDLGMSVVYPNVWTPRDGRHIYRIDAAKRQQSRADLTSTGTGEAGEAAWTWTEDPARSTPFPDAVARLVPAPLVPGAWALRALLRREWAFKLPPWLGADGDEVRITPSSVAGALFSVVACGLYLFCSNLSRPGLLNNLIALSTCYMALPEISGTSFVIASLVMISMFVYDVVMVFYTPMMATVAQAVQAPLLLSAHAGTRTGMLGLGDIAVPGIFVCLCLRYDQYRFYAGKMQTVETTLETAAETVVDGEYVTTVSTVAAPRTVKAAYVDPGGHWGDWVWTGALDKGSAAAAALAPGVAASSFPKPYFYVSLASYWVGLVLAHAAVEYTHKGQPALFYLVPVMLVATWGQAVCTGNVGDLWNYTENGSLDTKDVVVDVVGDGGNSAEEEAAAEEASKDRRSLGASTSSSVSSALRAEGGRRAQKKQASA